jgi:hypothetical protein
MGLDYWETYAPVASWPAIRSLRASATSLLNLTSCCSTIILLLSSVDNGMTEVREITCALLVNNLDYIASPTS